LGRVAIFALAIVLYANLIPALRAIGTALLASVSIVSLVIGLAAQNTLGNLIAGISLALYRPFEVGDLVQVHPPGGPEIGHIESLTLGYTVLRTDDNRRVIIPNSVMGAQVTINLTARDPRKLAAIPFRIGPAADVDKARAIVLDAARAHPLAGEVAGCPVVSLAGGGAVLSLRVWCADYGAAQKLEFDLYESVKKAFDAGGIPLA
jgi:small-conductance mechanosensitive channel